MKSRGKERNRRYQAPATIVDWARGLPRPFASIFLHLSDPGECDSLRRRVDDGKANTIELQMHVIAYSGPVGEGGRMQHMTYEQYLAGVSLKPGPPYLNAPPGLEWGVKGPPAESGEASLIAYVRKMARDFVEDPGYEETLDRRIADGKAAHMERWRLKKSLEDGARPRRPPLAFTDKTLPWRHDPLAEQERDMIAAQEREEHDHAAAAAAAPEEPSDPGALELVRDI
jgi:hypothetical protein